MRPHRAQSPASGRDGVASPSPVLTGAPGTRSDSRRPVPRLGRPPWCCALGTLGHPRASAPDGPRRLRSRPALRRAPGRPLPPPRQELTAAVPGLWGLPPAWGCPRELGAVLRQERGPRWDSLCHVLASQSSEGCGSGSEHPDCRPSTQMAEGPQPWSPWGQDTQEHNRYQASRAWAAEGWARSVLPGVQESWMALTSPGQPRGSSPAQAVAACS